MCTFWIFVWLQEWLFVGISTHLAWVYTIRWFLYMTLVDNLIYSKGKYGLRYIYLCIEYAKVNVITSNLDCFNSFWQYISQICLNYFRILLLLVRLIVLFWDEMVCCVYRKRRNYLVQYVEMWCWIVFVGYAGHHGLGMLRYDGK